jgi:hypothetical protein
MILVVPKISHNSNRRKARRYIYADFKKAQRIT